MQLVKTALPNHVLDVLVAFGVQEVALCPGGRNSAFVNLLEGHELVKSFTFYEERSAAFFALGRARQTKSAVAVIVTSGTAAAELLPATMEAYYTGGPLILVTADRPRRFRGTGAPQSAEQVNLFGPYVSYSIDLEGDEVCDLSNWDKLSPLHINVCLEDPGCFRTNDEFLFNDKQLNLETHLLNNHDDQLTRFLFSVSYPIVIVSQIEEEEKESVINFLVKLAVPVYLESTSEIREDERLKGISFRRADRILETANRFNYKIDGVLRIGGVPTVRLWRDLERLESKIQVCSINRLSFRGLTFGSMIQTNLKFFFQEYQLRKQFDPNKALKWLSHDGSFYNHLNQLIQEEKRASISLIRKISEVVPVNSHVYLGNSSPIREWDVGATLEDKKLKITANRGVNGIDGQMSSFFGLSESNRHNFAILGDLTTLYDMAAPWVLPQMPKMHVTVFVINNGGGKIFSRMFASKTFQNEHRLNFKPLADFWGLEYMRLEEIDDCVKESDRMRLIEVVPDQLASNRLLDRLHQF